MTCCHKLERVVCTIHPDHLELALENQYLAAIKAIDPDIMEFCEVSHLEDDSWTVAATMKCMESYLFESEVYVRSCEIILKVPL